MEIVKQALLILLTDQCYDEYFVKFNFFDVACLKATISKGLGLGIIAGSLLVKVPQILKIVQNKSGEGISVISVTLDLLAITIVVSYGYVSQFPFSSWGDGAFLAIQTAMIAFLVLHYANETFKGVVYIAAYVALCVLLMSGMTSMRVLWLLQAANIPILLTGKLTQAYTNYINGTTGQLSAATVFMLFFGSLARIFTSIQETGDTIMVITYCASTFANTIIVAQMLYYWNVADKQKKIT